MEFKVKNTEILLKYLNCLERVFFIDNKWMKEYNDIKKNVKKDYEGVPKYLSALISYAEKNELSILNKSLPNKEDIKNQTKPISVIILDSVSHSSFISDEEMQNYIVIACPQIERIFHFKADSIGEKDIFRKGTITNFDFHASLPRIKIYSKDIELTEEKANFDELKFIYTLPEDAQTQISSLKIYDEKILWDELVADPSYGVQIGNLGLYYIAPIKIKEIKTNPEDLHQVIVLTEDWKKKKFDFSITSEIYKKTFGEFPSPGILKKEVFVRCLTFQGYGENFRHILNCEKIGETRFMKDSIIAFIRFRKVVNKSLIESDILNETEEVQVYKDKIYYLPKGFSPDVFDSQEEFKTKDWANSIVKLRKYHEFESIYNFHSDWKSIYESNSNILEEYNPLKLTETPTYGMHRNLLRDLCYRFKFYARNKELQIFCLNCEDYFERNKTKDIPLECPKCKTKVLVAIKEEEDAERIKNNRVTDKKLIEEYNKKGSLFISYSKYLYYTLNFTELPLKTCVNILNEIKDILHDENEFFKKLFKITESYDRRYDIHNILYRIEKSEV